MVDAPLALAFTTGMIATVNPCGFVMLPAYLGYFLGIEDASQDGRPASASLGRALVVGATVSAGFLLLFAIAGMVASWTSVSVEQIGPWVTVPIGLALLAAGIAFLVGWEPVVRLPKLNRGGRTRGLGSMFVFGISYAVASLSCTLGPFLAVVAITFRRESVASGVATFLAYALGMASLLLVLTVSLALARQGVLVRLRKALPYFSRIAGFVMVLAGAYLTWYGIYEIRLIQRGEQDATQGPVGRITALSADVSDWLQRFDPLEVVLVVGLVVCGVVLALLLRSGRPGPEQPSGGEPADQPPVA